MTNLPEKDVIGLVRSFCQERALFAGAEALLVMVSGGQDSVMLLHLLVSGHLSPLAPPRLLVLHVNHHLRGPESDADQELVERLCFDLGVPLLVDHRPIDKALGNVQERARRARRAAALEAAARLARPLIVLGHTMDDQVETVLYRLGRYGGLGSLRGMKARDDPWVRPLLCVRRRETETYCLRHGLVFAQDRGNEYPGYARTGIRREVVPAWERALPGSVEACARATFVADDALTIVDRISERFEQAARRGERAWSARRIAVLDPPLRRAVIYRLLLYTATQNGSAADGVMSEGPEVSWAHVAAIEALILRPGSGQVGLGSGWVALKSYDEVALVLRAPQETEPPKPVELPVPGSVTWGRLKVRAEAGVDFAAPDIRHEAYIDAKVLSRGCLVVRSWQPGDRIRPLGGPGERKLQDVFTDAKIPVWQRAQIPIIECGGRVLWVAGLLVAEDARIGMETRDIIRLCIESYGREHP